MPPELSKLFQIAKPKPVKIFAEDDTQSLETIDDVQEVNVKNFNQLLMEELEKNKDLVKLGEANSSEGSDSAPSDDNLQADKLVKNLPAVDKTLKKKLKEQSEKIANAPTRKQSSTRLLLTKKISATNVHLTVLTTKLP